MALLVSRIIVPGAASYIPVRGPKFNDRSGNNFDIKRFLHFRSAWQIKVRTEPRMDLLKRSRTGAVNTILCAVYIYIYVAAVR